MEIIYTTRLQPDIVLFGNIRLCEPVIFLTDLLMALVCCLSFIHLRKIPHRDRVGILHQLFFLSMSGSALLGGLFGHLLQHYFSEKYRMAGWIFALLSTALLVQSSIERIGPGKPRASYRFWTGLNVFFLMAAIFFLWQTRWFPIVEMHTAFGLLTIVGVVETYLVYKHADKTARYLLAGLPFAMAAALAHLLRFSPGGVWFNFFDVGHVLLCGTFYCFFLGAKHYGQSLIAL